MTWEIIQKSLTGRGGNRPGWWTDPNVPGVAVTKIGLTLNKALTDLLKAGAGNSLLVLLDRQNNAFGLRSPQEDEKPGAFMLLAKKGGKGNSISLSITCKALIKAFPWLKSGLCFKAELIENGNYAMMVVRNKL